MSRYTLAGYEKSHAVTVGFDNPLQTFFVQVVDTRYPEVHPGHMLLWAGTAPGIIPTLAQLQAILSPYATLPDDLMQTLQQEFDARTPPTPLQRWAGQMLRPLWHRKETP